MSKEIPEEKRQRQLTPWERFKQLRMHQGKLIIRYFDADLTPEQVQEHLETNEPTARQKTAAQYEQEFFEAKQAMERMQGHKEWIAKFEETEKSRQHHMAIKAAERRAERKTRPIRWYAGVLLERNGQFISEFLGNRLNDDTQEIRVSPDQGLDIPKFLGKDEPFDLSRQRALELKALKDTVSRNKKNTPDLPER